MPTMSSFRSKPSFTPETMLAISARVRPCNARILRSSSGRPMTSTPLSSFTDSGDGMGWLSLPFGPSARTMPSPTCTFTPWGIGMGFLPMRDMSCPLPHVGEDFAADLLLAGLAVGHHALGGRDERDTHAGEDRRDLIVGDVDAPPRRGHTHEAGDHLLVADAVLEVDAEHVLLLVLEHAEVLDEALFLQQLRDADLELAGGDVALLVLGPAGVRDTRHLALEGELTEAQPAHPELTDVRPRAPAQLAAVVAARLELRRPLRLHDEGGLRHNLIAP